MIHTNLVTVGTQAWKKSKSYRLMFCALGIAVNLHSNVLGTRLRVATVTNLHRYFSILTGSNSLCATKVQREIMTA